MYKTSLEWTGLDCSERHLTGMDQTALHLTALDCTRLHQTAPDCTRLHYTALSWTELEITIQDSLHRTRLNLEGLLWIAQIAIELMLLHLT